MSETKNKKPRPLTIQQQLARIEKSVSLTGALEAVFEKTGQKVLSPNEFLVETYMDEKQPIDVRIKAAQAAKKDNKEIPQPAVTVNVNNSSESSSAPVTFDLDDVDEQ